jgi:hypothetical protein
VNHSASNRWMAPLFLLLLLIPLAPAASKAPVRGAQAMVVSTEPRATRSASPSQTWRER